MAARVERRLVVRAEHLCTACCTIRSTTFGMPRPRSPPPAFGIHTRRIVSRLGRSRRAARGQLRHDLPEVLAHLGDRLPVRSGRAVVRRHSLETLPSGSRLAPPPPSSSPAWLFSSCSSTSAPRAVAGCGSAPVRSAVVPLRAVGCLDGQFKLSLPVGWPWSPSLPVVASCGWDRLSTAFRYYATIRLLSSLRHLVLSSSTTTARVRLGGGREVSPGKNAELRPNTVASTHARRRISGFAADRPAHPRAMRLTALRFRSVPGSTFGFHQTLPRGLAWLAL